ncbi:GWxTD domain-containing protein [Gracilimonas tropica]|uniref:GWxTD domain-containing protein n=1 Tax=Gracilimonas tropica TaxID=454600 RepID=UPI00037A15B2|nr:GWxTD domain-containing protein [Gracilimonas tropica]
MVSRPEHIPFQFQFIILLLLGFLGTSCSSSYSGKADIGSEETVVPGLPFITLNASSNITEDQQTQAILFLSIQENSLIYKNQQDSLISRIEIWAEITPDDAPPVVSDMYQILLGKSPDTKYYEQNTIYRQLTYNIPPGDYNINLKITDLHSGKSTIRKRKIHIPDPDSDETAVSQVRFFHKPSPDADFVAVNGYNVNMGYDSLKFSFQLLNGEADKPTEVELKLVRFTADLDPARSMSGREHRNSSLVKKGLDYTRSETIQSTKRILNSPGSVTIENTYTELPRGNYRFEVSVKQPSAKTLYEVRDFGIKSENYPQVKSSFELARPLYYLMNESEYNDLLAIKNADSLKKAIDNFWLGNIKNAPKAREIIRLYYERVEEANKQFSNFKEGWKTDPGMIYILFGPPLYVDEGFGEMTWFYDFDTGVEERGFYFDDPRFGNNKFPFHNFQLERSDDFFGLQYRQIQSWKDGSIIYLSQ